ncbi:LytTR family DNA-binding domain-containing protein [Rheinheimera sp. F8]|uniref:LytR/AlgR family response regulator transcription factor n=1 Tax=Rheinheimera sp. F8 TaxID=1763998 RepID=UPI000744BAB1|nr:LytTR family DNA-binding domain-containing protein [Rheinheimera sp. F8]ALZ74663.1 hypothetical protein ATY27_02105 [Rheinheimera sp. F8]
MVRILIAEDEEILLQSLVLKLQKFWPAAEIVALCRDGHSALQALEQQQPDVAFLDIQMGALSGIDVAFLSAHACQLVFVTAYDQYAVKAFDKGAVDYLLKPYSDLRLQQCISRLQQQLQLSQTAPTPVVQRLKLQTGHKIWLQPVQQILYFRACGRYIEVVLPDRTALLRQPMKQLVNQLDPTLFWQIHRSLIINIDQLDHVRSSDAEQLWAYLRGVAEPLPVSRSFQHRFRQTPLLSSDQAD